MKLSLHVSVMVEEVLRYLNPREDGIYVDCTLGTGGHSLAILEKTGGRIKLIGIDWDEEALRISWERLKEYRGKINLVRANFADIAKILKEQGIQRVNGFIYDLGLSSLQLEDPYRGFSFLREAPLDMRMDKRGKITASHLVNRLSRKELEDILWSLGEERWAKRMAEFIVEERKKSPISTTKELVEVIKRAVPAKFRRGKRTHFATRAFQALRIAVNQELDNLEKSLSEAIGFLFSGGRLCVISYHSLEDRIVKRKFKKVEGKELRILTPKVVRPSFQEIRVNPKSRSAKLRAAEKL
ncbi:16S rRNA (cytosine(1402)-N(4))-methyltransferase [Candidatus Aerophobetes bacterium]|uniref:Ribosomal RNA small subunit methyltransferase H n=1 Tax=Aerophobetes bacterium TaxID=2030807 RepID=A0A662D9K2_UNCAE|nr:MAG: 16S rRNA (cytosine(1402)-N(4))-methyltransferase [Candidatus Aerophobetes bacterium]